VVAALAIVLAIFATSPAPDTSGIGPEGWTAIFTGVLAFSTIGLGILAIRSDRTARISATAAKDAATTAKQTLILANRAWIKAKITLGDRPLSFGDEHGAIVGAKFELINVGTAPAMHVSPQAWLEVAVERFNPLETYKRKAAEFRSGIYRGGETVFPGDKFPDPQEAISRAWSAVVSQTDIEARMAQLGPTDGLRLWLMACIDYTFPSDPDGHHQVGYMYMIHHRIPNTLIRPEHGPFLKEWLYLVPAPFGVPAD
jgi:hypothetical protein